jgi:chromosome segregation ATPase
MEDNIFLSRYNQVVLDNLTSVLKQNFIFQTQIQFFEEQIKEKDQLREQLEKDKTHLEKSITERESAIDYSSEILHLKSELKDKEEIIALSGSESPNAHRLQNALNQHMKDLAEKTKLIEGFEVDRAKDKTLLAQQLKLILKLEGMLPKDKSPVTKKVAKKVTAKKKFIPEQTVDESLSFISDGNASSGGTF